MTNIYVLIKSLLFPGAYLRGFWEQIACRICGIAVEDNRYLRDDEFTSHVEHEFAKSAGKAFVLCYLPYFATSLAAFFLGAVPLVSMFVLETDNLIVNAFSLVSWWFAVSVFCNQFPSIEDAMNMKEQVYKNGNILQKIIFAPGFVVTYVGAYAERYLVTFLIAVLGTVALVLL